MRNFFVTAVVCMSVAAVLALRAQTNSVSVPSETASPIVVHTNAPTEVRPTEIESSSGEFYMKSNVFVYHGNVHVDNPQMQLSCELLTIEAPKLTNGNLFNRATAMTNVVIDWVDENGTNHATADKAVYTYTKTNLAETLTAGQFVTNALVVLSGNPIVTGPSGSFQGDPVYWDRIKDTITSPNMTRTKIIQKGTNNSSIFETTAPNSRRQSK
jgi:lipopolysaccharide export system protein LptA